MKKSLLLMALLGSMTAAPIQAKEIWWKGVTHNPDTQMMEGAITTYKLLTPSYYTDSNMCWVASACNVIAWWQDRVEENGALIIPESAPRDYNVFLEERQLWTNMGGYQGVAIQEWMTGGSKLALGPGEAKQAGHDFAGYYPRLAGACLGEYNYRNKYGANPDTLSEHPEYPQYEYTLIQTYWFQHSNHDPNDPTKTQYQWASEKIVEFMENDWGVCWATNAHAMTVYGVEVDEDGLLTKIFNSDNNDFYTPKGKYTVLTVNEIKDGENKGCMDTSWRSGNESTYVANICALRTTGIRFLDYDVKVGNNLVKQDQDVFSHYCNLIVDGAEDYKLQYDLRDAKAPDSPVEALRVNLATEDNWLSSYEVYTDEEVATGHMHFKGGKVTLVEGVGKYDGGGSVEGTISFEESAVAGTNRTLAVDRTDTIAKEINLGATTGSNTLEVTEGHTATFGTLSGTGDLDKTGKGAAEVTNAVTLQGELRVKEGDFIFGKDVVLTGNTQLTVSAGAHVQGTEDKPVTLSITSGVHVNDGEMTLTTTVTAGTLKGSGTFGMVTIDGGEMIVGNSPGHQDYEGALTLNSGKLVFCVSGFDGASEGDNVGWDSGTYSTINMNGNDFVIDPEGKIVIAMSADAANSLTTTNGTLALTLATGLKSGAFTEEQLAALAQQTSFELSLEDGAGTEALTVLEAPKFSYKMVNDALVLTTGISGSSPTVPEPATGTLSLLALAALAARRRRK